jgi:hypothetical protein
MHWLWDLMESPVTDPASLARRTRWLTVIHLVLPAAALAILVLVAWRIKLLVTLAQRSNVETALLAFVVLFVLYLLATTGPATKGAVIVAVLGLLSEDRGQRYLQRWAAGEPREDKRAYLNVAVLDEAGSPVEVEIADDVGSLGRVRLDGVELAFLGVPEELSLSTFRLVTTTLGAVGRARHGAHFPRIVAWDGLDPETSERYAASARAFASLERALDKGPLWPRLELDAAGVARLAAVMREATAALRRDVRLPDIEYAAEFSIPVVPEPLAFMQLRRTQQHADAVASLGSATLVLLGVLAALAWLITWPPWVPGK